MPFSTTEQAEIKSYVAEYIATELNKKRIPELLPYTQYGDLSVDDLLALWMAGTNKTVHVPIAAIAEFINVGGTGTFEPVLKGDTIIHVVTAAEAVGNKIYEPSIAGMSFFLREEGRPMKPNEFNVLAGGGAEILNEDGTPKTLYEGQRYDLQVYELGTGGGIGNDPQITTGLFASTVEVTTNTTLTAEQINALVQLRGGNISVTATLPDTGTITDRGYFFIEASVNNQKENRVTTTGGQYIYMGGEQYSTIYIRPGESVILVKMGSNWYDVSRFNEVYNNVGEVKMRLQSFSVTLKNEVLANGQILSKTDFARLWAKVQASGDMLRTQADWNTNKGYYVDIDSGSFRIPDLRDMTLKGATDSRIPGSFQANQYPEHDHGQAVGEDGSGAYKSYVLDFNNKLPRDTIDENIRTGTAGTGDKVLVDSIGVVFTIKA